MPNSWKKIITSGSNAQLKGLFVKGDSQFNGGLIVTNLNQTSDTNKKVVVFDTTNKKFYYTSSLPVGVSSDPVFPFNENSVTQIFDGTPQFAGAQAAAVITGSLILKPSGGGYGAPFGPGFGASETFHEQVLTIFGTTVTEVPPNTISFFGTASHATQSVSASYVLSSSFSTESRTVFVDNEETSTNNHYFLMVDSGPKYTSASYSTRLYVNPNTGNISGSLTGTSSYADSGSFSLTSSFCTETSSYAVTASYALNIPDGLGGGGGLWYNGGTYWSSSLQDDSSPTKIGIGRQPTNYSLEVNGTMAATQDVIAFMSSDKRLKDNIKPIEDPIGKIKQIGGYSFDWNDNQSTYEGTDFGVIAQEIEQVLPSLVQTREDGYKGVKYDKIVSLLIEAIKDQQKQIDELKKLV